MNKILINIDNIIKILGFVGVGFSALFLVVGFIGWIADVHYNGWAFFLTMFAYAIATFLSSIPVLGFYYIVKAAMFYLRQNGQIEEEEEIENKFTDVPTTCEEADKM